MIIRVDKCKTFGIQKVNTATVQYSPKLVTNDAVIPPVGVNEGFTYLGSTVIQICQKVEKIPKIQI